MVVKKRKIIKPHHVSNAPKKSASKLSIYKHLFQCIQSILHSRWNHPTFVLAKQRNWNGWGKKTTQTSSNQHPRHQNTIPSKKATTTSTLQKKIQESRRPRLKNWCAHFLKGEEFRSNQPWSHWFLNSMTLIESKVAMALFSATSLAASSSALTWGLWRQVVALFNAFLFKRDERKCINQIVFQRRVESCCAAQIQEIHSWKSSSITLSCWVQENLSFITGYLDPRKKNKKSSFHFCGS